MALNIAISTGLVRISPSLTLFCNCSARFTSLPFKFLPSSPVVLFISPSAAPGAPCERSRISSAVISPPCEYTVYAIRNIPPAVSMTAAPPMAPLMELSTSVFSVFCFAVASMPATTSGSVCRILAYAGPNARMIVAVVPNSFMSIAPVSSWYTMLCASSSDIPPCRTAALRSTQPEYLVNTLTLTLSRFSRSPAAMAVESSAMARPVIMGTFSRKPASETSPLCISRPKRIALTLPGLSSFLVLPSNVMLTFAPGASCRYLNPAVLFLTSSVYTASSVPWKTAFSEVLSFRRNVPTVLSVAMGLAVPSPPPAKEIAVWPTSVSLRTPSSMRISVILLVLAPPSASCVENWPSDWPLAASMVSTPF